MKRINWLLIVILMVGIFAQSCVSVASYQKVYLNDENMDLNARKVAVFETNFEAYREGASGANGGKTGGGCGCN